MTATAEITVNRVENSILVPNAALRFYPKPEQVRPEDRPLLEGNEEQPKTEEGSENVEAQRSAMERSIARKNRNRRHVWIAEGDFLRAVAVTTGLSDSQFTEIVSGSLTEGQELVTGTQPRIP